MFNMHMIGNYISFLRKKNKLTQGQLAERLGVSHQAVSNWERGEAMPDVSLLQSIARILGTTVDRLLATGSTDPGEAETRLDKQQGSKPALPVQNDSRTAPADFNRPTTNGDDGSMDANNHINSDKLPKNIESAGISTNPSSNAEYERVYLPDNDGGFVEAFVLKSKADKVYKPEPSQPAVSEAPEPSETINRKIDLEKIIQLAPFASEETLEKLVNKIVLDARENGGQKIELKTLSRLAPFLSEKSLDSLLQLFNGEGDWTAIVSLAPFLSDESLGMLIKRVDLDADFEKICSLAPFLSEESLNILVEQIDETVEYEKIVKLAPFLSEENLDKLIMRNI